MPVPMSPPPPLQLGRRSEHAPVETARRGASTATTRAPTGVVPPQEVAGQFLVDKTTAKALAATVFTPRDAESPHKVGHVAFLAVQQAATAAYHVGGAVIAAWCKRQ